MAVALVPGEEEKLEACMRDYGQAVKQLCFSYLKDYHLAEDATQDTFVKLFRAIQKGQLANAASERAYVLRMALNVCHDLRRRAWFRREDQHLSVENLPSLAAPPDSLRELLFDLPVPHRVVLTLYYAHGMTMEEIAAVLHCSVTGVHRKLKAAQAALRQELTEGMEGGSIHETRFRE
mgnify:FL=1